MISVSHGHEGVKRETYYHPYFLWIKHKISINISKYNTFDMSCYVMVPDKYDSTQIMFLCKIQYYNIGHSLTMYLFNTPRVDDKFW